MGLPVAIALRLNSPDWVIWGYSLSYPLSTIIALYFKILQPVKKFLRLGRFLIRNTQSEKLRVFRPSMKARRGFNHRHSFLNINILGSVKRAKAPKLKILGWIHRCKPGKQTPNHTSKPYIKGTWGLHETKGLDP